MLKLYYGTELETLAKQLLEDFDENSPENILRPEIFVVPNHGMGQWLSLEMARKNDIAANLEFEFPSERIWKLIRSIDAGIPDTLPSDRGPMTWSLMRLLQDPQVLSDFDNLRHYVQDDDPTQQSVRNWKLSSKIADVFDQYLVYRPDMLLDWEQNNLRYNREAERWQAKLWRKLMRYWKQHYDGQWLHRAQLQQELLEHFKKGSFNKSQLPERVTVFGVSTLPPIFVEIMVALSEIIDVNFYQLSANPKVENPEEFENSLLQSLGKESARFMSVYSRFAKKNYTLAGKANRSSNTSLFKEIQADILRDDSPDGGNLFSSVIDSSIQVHACHSPMREVEVLYDQLLAVLDENQDMNPDDILIMTPDIETYAPMIDAVFGMPDEGQPQIPYSIADRGVQGAGPAVQSFLKIMELAESRFKVTDVLDLLDANPVQEAFGFSEDDLNRLEMWIRDNRVRWGIDGSFKKEMEVPESDHFTWKSGLNRMLLGYAMKQDGDQMHDDIFPYEEIETSADAELAGKFSNFLHALFDISGKVQHPQTPRQWTKELGRVVDKFLPDNRDYFRGISSIRDALEQLNESTSLGNFDGKLPFRIIRSSLEEHLEDQSTGGGRIGRGVTFSSLTPMRSIPFKMIGMIGMNDGAFPRSKIPIEFDLMNLEPQPGDPIRMEEDRYLFLENLWSARSNIYFSYVGKSNRQDTDFPPSVVLREFLDYLEEHYGLDANDLVTKHRLQSFSTSYFKDENEADEELFSYSQTQHQISEQLLNGSGEANGFMDRPLPEPEEHLKQLTINDLVSFFQHPAKLLLRNRLGIYLGEDDVLTDDREFFTLEKLNKHYVKQELLSHFLKGQSLDTLEHTLRSRDMLPEGWAGRQAYQQRVKAVQDFGSEIQSRLEQHQLEDCGVDVEINDFRIVGKLTDLYENAQILYRFGQERPKDLVNLWIRHLLFQLVKPVGHSGSSYLFTWKDGFEQTKVNPVNDAKSILQELLNDYWKGMQQRSDFFPRSSYEYAKSLLVKNKDEQKARENALSEWSESYNGPPGEGEDPYNQLLTENENPIHNADFANVSLKFWTPFLKASGQEGQ